MTSLITPRTLKGFRDYLPEAMIPRRKLIETASQVYQSYGFSPIDTPALEYLDILMGKGSEETDKQLYKFKDNGGREVGMRFDLTVPLARFVSQHMNELGTPFKRFHIATVWRGENPQSGRYREFMQCDFDTIGTTHISADIESTLIIYDLMRKIGFQRFSIHLNNRKILSGLLEKLNLTEKTVPVLRALDKITKIGYDAVLKEMSQTAGTTEEQAKNVLQLATLQGSNQEILEKLALLVSGSEKGESGHADLSAILTAAAAVGIPEENLKLDVSIARGLDYYTGTIWETFLEDLPALGSVCSGGRYDNLTGMFMKQPVPGIGASLGLDRLLSGMEQLGMLPSLKTPVEVFIPFFDAEKLHEYLRIAAMLRAAGIGVEIYPEPKKLGAQLKYADKKGFRYAIIAGTSEIESQIFQVKDLHAQTQTDVPQQQLLEYLKKNI
ncbi:MAG: histidine--tRNA ligase [Planctomycetia bacterium]|nr:histidine--tRNA ligase [Planctomycetia bacterium]